MDAVQTCADFLHSEPDSPDSHCTALVSTKMNMQVTVQEEAQRKNTGDWICLAAEAFELNANFTAHSNLICSKPRTAQEQNMELDDLQRDLPGFVTNKLRDSHGFGRCSSLLAVEREVGECILFSSSIWSSNLRF